MDRDITQIASIQQVDVVTGHFIINGHEQVTTSKAFALTCPNCGDVLYTFEIGTTEADILKALSTDEMSKSKKIYCAVCGQKITYYRGSIIDIEVISMRDIDE